MKYEIIDNFLEPSYYNLVANAVEGLRWDYVANIAGPERNDLKISHQGFSHYIFRDNTQLSEVYPLMLPMLENIRHIANNKYCYRARAAMTLQTGERQVHDHHVDMGHKHNSAIFYINDSDGDTILYNEECPVNTASTHDPSVKRPKLDDLTECVRIRPRANRLVIFEGNYWHTGESPLDHARRVIINMNFGDEKI